MKNIRLCMLILIFMPMIALTDTTPSVTNFINLEKKIQDIEAALSAHIGVAILDTRSQQMWNYKGDQRVPLMSTFKTFACAKLLKDAETGKGDLNSTVKLEKQMLVSYSPVTELHVGELFSLREACAATMLTSDNSAANIVLKEIGGPAALTQFMRSMGDSVTRLDRIETDLNEATPGDIRDTTTPNAVTRSLSQILFSNVLSSQSAKQLKQWMINNTTGDGMLRSVLPDSWIIGDRTGAGGFGSRAITAVVWPTDQRTIIIAIYITQTDASFKRRNKAIAEIGKEIFDNLGE